MRWEAPPRWNTSEMGMLMDVMNNLKHFEGQTFEADVLQSPVPVVVDFYADWCGPCRAMAPTVEQLAVEFAGKVSVGKLDVDVNQDIAIRYGVMGIPTLGLFRGGKLVDRMVGYPGGAAPIKAWIEKNVSATAEA
jgi:thioredoxin 1